MSRKAKLYFSVSIIFLIALLLIWLTRPLAPMQPAKRSGARVEAERISVGNISPELHVHAQLHPHAITTLTSTLSADVQTVRVRPGHYVRKGQLLLKLNDQEIALHVSQKRAKVQEVRAEIAQERLRYKNDKTLFKHEQHVLALNKKALERQSSLAKKNYSSSAKSEEAESKFREQQIKVRAREHALELHQHRLDKLQAQLSYANAALSQSEIDLKRSAIVSPYAGYIQTVDVAPGDRVQANKDLVTLYAMQSLELVTQIPLRYYQPLQRALAQKQTINATAHFSDTRFDCVLRRLGAHIKAGQASIDAYFAPKQGYFHWPSGIVTEMNITLPAIKHAVMLPNTALFNNNRIYQIVDDHLRAIKIKKVGNIGGHSDRSYAVITSTQLKPGLLIMTSRLPNAVSGLKVSPSIIRKN